MSDVEIDEFLAHYGVPGMKWGVRKDRSQRTPEEAAAISAKRKATAKKVAVVGGVAAVTAGAIYANSLMKKQAAHTSLQKLEASQKRLNDLKSYAESIGKNGPLTSNERRVMSSVNSGKTFTDVYFRGGAGSPSRIGDAIPMPAAPGKTKLSDLSKAAPLGANMRTELRRERARRNQEVTTQLRGWYNQANTPIKDRWYPDANGVK